VTTTRAAELLTINEVEVHRFGGLSERTVTLPDDPLVVIVGPNEAGKSTLAELIAWLLAGPVGSAADAQRYGAPSDRIGGRLVGRLGAHPFVATGDFRVLKAGTPNDNGLRVRLDGDLDVARWRARLGAASTRRCSPRSTGCGASNSTPAAAHTTNSRRLPWLHSVVGSIHTCSPASSPKRSVASPPLEPQVLVRSLRCATASLRSRIVGGWQPPPPSGGPNSVST
jgi:energy-coupling factor transporter ATP-binding protein EcfA2